MTILIFLLGLVFFGLEIIWRWRPTSCVARIKALAAKATLEVI